MRTRWSFDVTGRLLLVLVMVLVALPNVAAAEAQGAPSKIGLASRTDLPHSQDHVLVELQPGASPDDVLGQGAEMVMGRWHIQPVPPGKTPIDTVEVLASRPGVETVELDYRIQLDPVSAQMPSAQAHGLSIDDPLYEYQWHLPAVRANHAWTVASGDDVVVAVVDSGVAQDGVDLDCHTFVALYNAITQTQGAEAATDDNGHGTHVAGTIAQCTDNGTGVAGVAFDASLMPVKVLDENGSGEFSWLVRGIDWARNNGADVINMSLGCDGCSSSAVNDAIQAARAQGVVIVAASGNSSSAQVSYPASHPDVIAVGATDFDDERAWYSNQGSALDVVAPGGDLSQDANGDGYGDGVLQETFYGSYGWRYYFFQGTSMATPHVAGAVALLLAADPGLEPAGVQQILEETALDLGPGGFDEAYGYGLIQIYDALDLVVPDTTAPTWPGSGELVTSDVTGTTVDLTWPTGSDDRDVLSYRVYVDGKLVKTVEASQTTTTVSNLKPVTGYEFGVRAVDLSENPSKFLSAGATTLDTLAPKWGSGAEVSVVSYGETSLTLGWDAATDNVGVTGYRLLVDGVVVASSTVRQLEATGLQPGEEYRVEVMARDEEGNWSDVLAGVVNTALDFGDTTGHTFYSDILWMSGSGVTRGCNPPENDLFCPDDPVTRGQMAAFLVRALGLTVDDHGDFEDVPSSSTFAADIGKLATAGITRGCNPPENDLFCPDDPVTRAQMAAFLVRALGLTVDDHPGFVDVPEDSTFAGDIHRLATAGITHGCNPPTNDRFCPNDPITRGQLAAFLHRALD